MPTKQKSTFDATSSIKKITNKLYESHLDPEVLKSIQPELRKMKKFLDLEDENQALIFSIVFIQNYVGISSSLREMIEFLGITQMGFIDLKPALDAIIEKRLIYTFFNGSFRMGTKFTYEDLTVNADILEAITENKPLKQHTIKTLDIFSFCQRVSNLIEERKNDKFNSRTLFTMIEQLEAQNHLLPAVVDLKSLNITLDGRILLYEMCDDLVHDPSAARTGLEITMKDIYDDTRIRIRKIREIIEQESELVHLDLVVSNSGTFINDFTVSLTHKAINILLAEDAKIYTQKKTSRNLLAAESIAPKELFFDEQLANQLTFFKNSLKQENFISLQERLSGMNMNKGITAVFYGAPGTGKTESVYQMARETGRDVYMVDISQTKSMWFGESEKRVKGIFNNYRRLCKESEITPILLFNEADAVLTQRKEDMSSKVSNTENAIQNIILEELERFEGILIATTNLINNLDIAFERRFIFKVEFQKPSVEAKKQIWQSKLNWLNPSDAEVLSNKYTFSGGEIDNVVRKATLNEVLTGTRPDISELFVYCDTERFTSKLSKVGY